MTCVGCAFAPYGISLACPNASGSAIKTPSVAPPKSLAGSRLRVG